MNELGFLGFVKGSYLSRFILHNSIQDIMKIRSDVLFEFLSVKAGKLEPFLNCNTSLLYKIFICNLLN